MRLIHFCVALMGAGLVLAGFGPASAAPDDPAAWVNGVVIRQDDLKTVASAQKRQWAGLGIRPNRSRAADLPLAALNGLILRELALQECRRQGIFISAAEINARLKAIEAQVGSRRALKDALKSADLTRTRLKALVSGDLAVAKLIERMVAPGVMVDDDDVREFYKRYPHIFRTPEMVRARHILVALPDRPAEDEIAEARYQIEDLRGRIGREDDFTGIAVKYSEDKTTSHVGGDLGFFPRADMEKPFGDAAFGQEPGQISEPVRTVYGFHLIQVTDRRPADRMPLDSVTSVIRREVRQAHIDQAAQKYLERLKAGADIRIP